MMIFPTLKLFSIAVWKMSTDSSLSLEAIESAAEVPQRRSGVAPDYSVILA